jgi:hypothetical protein
MPGLPPPASPRAGQLTQAALPLIEAGAGPSAPGVLPADATEARKAVPVSVDSHPALHLRSIPRTVRHLDLDREGAGLAEGMAQADVARAAPLAQAGCGLRAN